MSNAVEIFSRNWEVYEKILLHNYMHHKELQMQLANVLQTFNGTNKIHFLDLGCGDCSQVAGFINQQNFEKYTGYDMSAAALDIANRHLASSSKANIALNQGEMLSLLKADTNKYNIIYSSFAIHHLHDNDKQELFSQCYNHLFQRGVLIYTDVFRSMGQSREKYLEEYFDNMHRHWKQMDINDKLLISEHVGTYDFPSVKSEVFDWLKSTGFSILKTFDADKWHQLVVAEKGGD